MSEEIELPVIPLTITQVSTFVGVTNSQIRYWESIFKDYLKPKRSAGGHREYNAGDVNRLIRVRRLLKEQGFTLTGALRQLEMEK